MITGSQSSHVLGLQEQGPTKVRGLGTVLNIGIESGDKSEAKAYCYDVEITDNNGEVFSNGAADEARSMLLWQTNCEIMRIASEGTRGFGYRGRMSYVYDGGRELYTSVRLPLPEVTDGEQSIRTRTVEVPAGEREEDTLLPDGIVGPWEDEEPEEEPEEEPNQRPVEGEFERLISPFFGSTNLTVTLTEKGSLNLSDNGDALEDSADGDWINAEKRKFLNLLMVEAILDSKGRCFYQYGSGRIFHIPTMGMNINGVSTRRPALFIQPRITGTPEAPKISLAADVEHHAFYTEQSLEDALQLFLANGADYNCFIKFMRGVRCYLQYDQTRSVVIEGWTETDVGHLMLSDSRGEMLQPPTSMVSVFGQHYRDLNLRRRAIRVSSQQPDHLHFYDAYPIESLFIMPHQRLPLRNMSGAVVDALIHRNLADTPEVGVKRIQLMLSSGPAVELLRAFGVNLATGLDSCEIRLLGPLSIMYGRNGTVDVEKPDWTEEAVGRQYVQPMHIGKWILAYDAGLSCHRKGKPIDVPALIAKFAAEFVRIALARGMQIGVPQIEPVNGIDALTSMRRPPNASIVMYVGNEANESHEKLKYWESESRILTQHVPTSVVSKMDPRVLNDLAAKMNAKMGGFSYRPSLGAFNQRTVFIMALATATTQPDSVKQRDALRRIPSAVSVPDRGHNSIIGFCANRATGQFCSYKYYGDYEFYRRTRRTPDAATVTGITERTYRRFAGTARNFHAPSIIFRYCSSESMFAEIRRQELPAIQEGIRAAGGDPTNIALILVTNEHPIYYWPVDDEDRAVALGAYGRTGRAVYSGDYRRGQPEFLLQSFCLHEGGTKYGHYVVAHNSTGFKTAELRDMIYGLCYSRQTKASPTSLPLPVNQALQLIPRCRSNFDQYNNKVANGTYGHARQTICHRDAGNPLADKFITA